MILEELKQIPAINGVLKISDVDESYEKMILKIRKLENRIYTDDEVKLLPFASKLNPQKEEWELRAKSFLRFKEYLIKRNSELNVLDIGCGTGWLASKILKDQSHNFFCVDINLSDLEQGARVFPSDKIKFIYADLFAVQFPRSSFDLVIFNSSLQYFSDLKVLMRELFYLLKSYGEIHIFDSPFYSEDEIEFAKNKINRYYYSLGCPQISNKYFYHTLKDLSGFNTNILYDPNTIKNKLSRIAFGNDSPFPWVVVKR